jgi:predicted Zn-dependent protease with MMP-like domain
MRELRRRLRKEAEKEVEATLRALPVPLRERAREVPVTFMAAPSRAMVEDGVDPDLLGVFAGEAFPDEPAAAPMPAHIILFLDNIWDEAAGDEENFLREVRTTYLHELGHYLGLDEPGLEDRGLE